MTRVPDALSGLRGEVSVLDDAQQVARAAADIVQRAAEAACTAHGSFSIALAGGNTPRALYETLAAAHRRDEIEWPLWFVYFGDERAVAPDHPDSNYNMAKLALIDRVPLDPERVRRMRGELADPDLAADEYAVTLHGDLPEGPAAAPLLDCILLGLGENGHTASLFPGTPALTVRDRWVTRGRADYQPFDRLTLTYPTINAARLILFMVVGATKAQALRDTAARATPASDVQPANGRLIWLLDRSAVHDS